MPVHLDYTTFYGAALCLESSSEYVPLSCLLSLSQFIEALVLHDEMEYENGLTDDWQPYREALERTKLFKEACTGKLPIRPSQVQVDATDQDVVEAANWVIDRAAYVDPHALYWAAQIRTDTYKTITKIDDRKNVVMRRYQQVVREVGSEGVRNGFTRLCEQFDGKGLGLISVHILMRLRLIQRRIVESGHSHYSPHFSRQPLIAAWPNSLLEIQRWTIEQLRQRRKDLIDAIEPLEDESLGVRLSPILFACLRDASSPLDLIENAMSFRESNAAVAYRQECRDLLFHEAIDDPTAIRRYKLRVCERLKELDTILFEKGRPEVIQQVSFDPTRVIPFGYNVGIRWPIGHKSAVLGDRTVVFLRNVFADSLACGNDSAEIADVLGKPVDDISICGLRLPGHSILPKKE